ncbi:MAG: peptidoglycan DD-metalloendopeptidase family protein [Oscillospiraceae bacterium]|nr:peptidoglycan DD-metalloendopeptidase family protein [Oscillospiraceae bacterium]
MKRFLMKFTAVTIAVCLTTGTILRDSGFFSGDDVLAKTIAEVEAEKKAKQAEIEKKRSEIDSLSRDISNAEQYQTALQEQIALINGKLTLIDSELQALNADMEEKSAEVMNLQTEIEEQQIAVDQGLQTFKGRIRSMYMQGNEGMLSALLGASDFYDVLAKVELINRIAKHDNEMIDNLKNGLRKLETDKQELNTKLQALSLKQTEMETLLKEFNESREELDDAYAKTDEAKSDLQQQQLQANGDLSEFQSELDALEAEEEQLILEAARKAEEERRRREEEERRRREEESRRRVSESQSVSVSKEESREAARTTAAPVTDANGQTVTTAKTTKKTTVTSTSTTKYTPPPVYNGKLSWPAPGFYHISSGFGWRFNGKSYHKGIDIAGAGIHYQPACAAAAGTVSRVKGGCTHDYGTACKCNGGYGNYVMIDHGNGLQTLYAHLAAITVSVGQSVSTGTQVGKIGATGNIVSSGGGGYHLHFSVIVNGTFVDPKPYLGIS